MSNSNQVVVVVASNFQSFIGSMKANLKLGYAKCEESTYVNGFFRARLVKETDEAYVSRLSGFCGEERENVLDLVDFITGAKPVSQKLAEEVKEIVKDVNVEIDKPLQTEAVTTTIKRTRQPRKEKK